ncbi:YppG family protein [Cytobacillus sp. NCCP-133]|uniref:YppG family protein n=1 Tax=Cytobacillus sp. NCCP-133 TaxID=766848 RepID=UPI00223099EE|nr:YppG family protein [Cytobacillus sp. NCCP-133]GLB57949.1 hypothetical protein NCCP133_00820 [Cytobacillus sp. NCCP-133]
MFGRKINRASHFPPYGHWNVVHDSDPNDMGMNGRYYMRQQPMQNYQGSAQQGNPYYLPYEMGYQQHLPGQNSNYGSQPNYSPNPYPNHGPQPNYSPNPYPNHGPQPNYGSNPYLNYGPQPNYGSNPYPNHGSQPNFNPHSFQVTGNESDYYKTEAVQNQSIFQNPLESEDFNGTNQKQQPMQPPYPYMNPYPKQSFIPKQPSGVQSIMNSFKAQDGSIDLNKMVDTAGQMMNAVNQVSSMVKGIGGIFKA